MQKINRQESSSERSNAGHRIRPSSHISHTNSQKKLMGDRGHSNDQYGFFVEGLHSTESKSSRTSQLLSSQGSSYTPSIGSKNRSSKSDEYKEDNQEDIEDIRLFLDQNKRLLQKCRRRIIVPIQESGLSPQIQEKQNVWIWFFFILGFFLFCFLVYFFFSDKKAEVRGKMQALAMNCWQKFKQEKCDLNNPLGNMCRQLYDCYLKQKYQRPGKQGEDSAISKKKQQSLVQEILFTLITLLVGYFVGIERIQRGTVIVMRLAGQFMRVLRQIRQRNRQN